MRLLTFLQLIRAPNGITALSNIIAAGFVVSAQYIDWPSLVLLCIASLGLYYSGMIINDCLDLKEDLAERPTRPLPSGALSIKKAWTIAAVLSVASLCCASWVSLQSFYCAVTLLVVIFLYNGLIKEGLPGALTMGMCRYLNWLMGLSLVPLNLHSFFLPLPILFFIAALTYLSKQETKAENPKALYVVAALLVVCMAALLSLTIELFSFNMINLLAIAVFCGLLAYQLLHTLKNFSPQNVQATVVWMIIAIIPLDALMSLIAGNYWVSALLIVLIWPCRILSKKLYMT